MNTQIQKTDKSTSPINTIRDLLEKQAGQIAIALPKHLTADRLTRVALTTINKNAKLLECTPHSLLACIMDCAALGLEPDGRRAHLIPFNDRKNDRVICTLIVDYKGLVELVMNAGDVSNIHADIICDKDEFEYDRGTIQKHKINFREPRGAMYAAYVIITMKDGTTKSEVMTKDEVDGIRSRSRAATGGPWVTDYNEMAKKTVFRRASKWVKLSPELRERIEKDDDAEIGRLPEIKTPKFGNEISFLPAPATATIQPDVPASEAVQEAPPVEPQPDAAPVSDGIKTRRMNALCKAQEIELGDALKYIGEMGYPSFEDCTDRYIEVQEKHPSTFAKAVNEVAGK